MTTRRGYDRGNTAHACYRLSVSQAGACPNGGNLRQSCVRDCRANRVSATAIASTPRVVTDHRRNWPRLARSLGPSTALKSP